MSEPVPNDGNTVHVSPAIRRAPSFDAMPVMESPSYRIQRWIGEQDPYPATMSKLRDSVEARARRQHDHFAEVDWELEEFEREMAIRFVMRDLQLGLEERRSRTSTSSRTHGDTQFDMNTITRADSERKRSLTPWLRTQSSTATLQPLTRLEGQRPTSPPPHSPSPVQSSFPPTPRTSHSRTVPPTTPATHELSARSPPCDSLTRLFRSSGPQKPSPSVLSLTSHFSSCTSSASASADTDAELNTGPSESTRSVVSQIGQKIKYGVLQHSTTSPYISRGQKTTSPTFMELTPPGVVSKKRRVNVPVVLVSKKKRLIVRGIKMDDDYGVEGVRRWANGLGKVGHMCRAQDGSIWIEFRDKRVAENVCRLQAQVQIPRVGRVVLDWAEGRHPG